MNPNSPLKTDPLFNVKVVVNETGLKPDTLRAWERRYGLPQPQRTKGGHRLYSAHDINVLKWLVARQQEGMSISRAVSHLKQLLAEDIDPFAADEPATPPIPKEGNIARLREAWVTACIGYNETLAENALNQAFAMYPQELVCTAVLQKGLVEIGNLWYTGKVSVQQEHFASALAMRRIQNLIAAAPPATRVEKIVVGCPEKEEHEFAPLLFSLLLRRHGWQVTYLGAKVPIEKLQITLETLKPNLLIMSAQHLPAAAALRETALLARTTETSFAFAGSIFARTPNLSKIIPGTYLKNDVQQAVAQAEAIVKYSTKLPDIPTIPMDYWKTLASYQQQKASIHAQIWEEMVANNIPTEKLDVRNLDFSNHIEAALKLGNIDFLNNSLDWLRGLLGNNNVPNMELSHYLQTYHSAVKNQITHDARPLLDWFTNQNGITP